MDEQNTFEPRLSRRELLTRGSAAAAGGLGLGGLVWGRHARAVDRFETELLAKAAPEMTARAHEELIALPAQAREAIRVFFDGVCLDVHSFTSEVCSQRFVEKLAGCPSDESRHQLMVLTFEQRVTTAEAVLNRIHTIADELGTELDRNWARCCVRIADAWGVSLREYDAAFSADQLAAAVEPQVRADIERMVLRTATAISRLSFGDVPIRVGKSALLLLPLTACAPNVVLPVFVGLALKHIIAPVIAWLMRPDPGDLQRDVSERMALLGNQVGTEFEQETRRRISDLQNWRETALQRVARTQAERVVQWF